MPTIQEKVQAAVDKIRKLEQEPIPVDAQHRLRMRDYQDAARYLASAADTFLKELDLVCQHCNTTFDEVSQSDDSDVSTPSQVVAVTLQHELDKLDFLQEEHAALEARFKNLVSAIKDALPHNRHAADLISGKCRRCSEKIQMGYTICLGCARDDEP